MRKHLLMGMLAILVSAGLPRTAMLAGPSEFDMELIKLIERYDTELQKLAQHQADKGDQTARCILGLRFALGQSGKQDYGMAAKYLIGLDYKTCAYGTVVKGLMYRDGLGVEKDLERSRFWFRRAGLLLNDMKIDDLYVPQGADVTKELEEARAWHDRLFNKADPESQYREARKYLSGDGVMVDPVIARELLAKPVIAKFPGAMYELGKGYIDGVFPTERPREGIRWLYYAAKDGVAAAQKELAVWYATHVTRQRDNFKAYFWLRYAKLTEADLGPLAAEIARRVSATEKGVFDRMLESDSFPAP